MPLPPKFAIASVKFIWTALWQQMVSQLAPRSPSGEYLRPESQFRQFIGFEDGNPYPPEANRYRLYVGLSCPWAHRTLVVRAIKGLESAVAVTYVSASSTDGGWVFEQPEAGCRTLAELYQKAKPGYNGRSTVPVLWDSQTQTIVNNESAEVILMLNAQFNQWATYDDLDLYPENLQTQIEYWNAKIYPAVNNGVYRCGFAQTQAAYDKACSELFSTLDEIEQVLATQRYLCGDKLTLADVRLFTTLFRFDAVYFGLFKCNLHRISDYPNLGAYLRDIYQLPSVADTCALEQVKQDYYKNLFPLNPGGIIPLGPDLADLLAPHGRDRLVLTQKQS